MKPHRRFRLVSSVLCGLMVLAGCAIGSPASVVTPSPTGAIAEHCKAAVGVMPEQINSMKGVVMPNGAVARWGTKDEIVWRCGVDKPAALNETSPCAEINGVGWFAEEQSKAWVFTTIGRDGYAEVTVPKKYQPAADALVDLTKAAKALPEVKPCQ